jgi:hypothetical protein
MQKSGIIALALLLTAPPALAQTSIGVVGLAYPYLYLAGGELEYSPDGLGINARFFSGIPSESVGGSILAQWSTLLSETSQMGVMAGLAQQWNQPRIPMIAPDGTQVRRLFQGPLEFALGGFYQQQWGKFRLRLTPNISIPYAPGITLYPLELLRTPFIQGPAWIEVGYRITPNMECCLRSCLLPMKLSWEF